MLRAVRLILPALFLLVLPVQAAVFTVTKTADTLDGACDHDCSLREAVSAANVQETESPTDVVVVPAGIYRLERLGAGEDLNATGDLDIHDRMILVGAGAGSTVLDGIGFDRVLDARARTEIFGVTIRNGRVDGDGGGLLVRPVSPDGGIFLRRSVVSGNLAQTAGAAAASRSTASWRSARARSWRTRPRARRPRPCRSPTTPATTGSSIRRTWR